MINIKLIDTLSAILIASMLVACAQTTATKSTSPQQKETRQTSPTDRKKAPESAESGQPESQSKSGEATRPEKSKSQKAESPSPTSAEAESQKTDQKASVGQKSDQDPADAKLAEARENLRISEETEKRIASELEQLKTSGNASEEAVSDYETYLKSVEAMTAENRKIVEQMESAYAKQSSGNAGANQLADPDIPEEQTMDEVAALDRQLNASLAKFDGMLLKEMDEIRAGSSKKLQDLAEEAAEAAKRLRDKGLDVNTSGSESSEEGQQDREGRDATDQEMESSGGQTGGRNNRERWISQKRSGISQQKTTPGKLR